MNPSVLYLSLIYIAEADGILCRSEMELIKSLCPHSEEIEARNITLEDIDFFPDENLEEVIVHCIRLSLIDGHYDARERKRVYELAEHFKINEASCKEIEDREMKMEWLSRGPSLQIE